VIIVITAWVTDQWSQSAFDKFVSRNKMIWHYKDLAWINWNVSNILLTTNEKFFEATLLGGIFLCSGNLKHSSLSVVIILQHICCTGTLVQKLAIHFCDVDLYEAESIIVRLISILILKQEAPLKLLLFLLLATVPQIDSASAFVVDRVKIFITFSLIIMQNLIAVLILCTRM